MTEHIDRREFLTDAAIAGAGLSALSCPTSTMAAGANEFVSQWDRTNDRIWIGPEFWSNPLQDWRIAAGRLECINAAPNRNVHLLTRQIGDQAGDLSISVKLGRIGGKLAAGKGSAGWRLGIQGPLNEYRNTIAHGVGGLEIGITATGKLFIGGLANAGACNVDVEHLELRLTVDPKGPTCDITLSAIGPDGKELGKVTRAGYESSKLVGNIALVANFFGGAGVGKQKNAAKKKEAAPAEGESIGNGEFWFRDLKVAGSRLVARDNQAFGPILFNHYTLSQGVMTMTVQMPPIGAKDSQTVRLLLPHGNDWRAIAEETIHPDARTATFRIPNWDSARDWPYNLAYSTGPSSEHIHSGTIRKDPVDQPTITVADVSCNIHEAFPNVGYTANMKQLNPDLIAFVGDQFYESTGGFGVQRAPLDKAILDYLRKWYFHGWTWRDLTRDRPSISIPDDHDVYQGNLWGEAGAAQKTTQEAGGYNMPAEWVNVVHRTQTSHHPAPWDPTPCQQGISVYSCPLIYGRISFAILADRQFKNGPDGKVPSTGGRPDHVTDPNFDPKSVDLPGLQLLGPGQLKHVKEWVRDWRGCEMKAVISQTIFTGMATTHGGPNGRLVADYDTNGWPQSERNTALREIRKAFAIHVAGDQHLPAVIHYGIDEHRDAGWAFAGPAVNTGYPRWFEPLGAAEVIGDFRDTFGHPLTVRAVANPSKTPRAPVMEKMHDKVSGLGLVRFHKPDRNITIECWPFLADVSKPDRQFPGWPVTIGMLDNYGRKVRAHLPELIITGCDRPVVAVLDNATRELIYNLRLQSNRWRPHAFAPGAYTVVVSDPETGRSQSRDNVIAEPQSTALLEITL